MRIAIDIRPLTVPRTGTGTYAFNLIREIAKIDKENEYWLCAHRDIAEGCGEIGNSNFHLQINHYSLGFLWQQLYLPSLLRRLKIDLFHSTLLTLPFSVPCPSVVTIHDLVFKMFPEKHTFANRTITNFSVANSVKISQRVIADSENTKKDLIKSLSVEEGKIKVTLLAAEGIYRPCEDFPSLNKIRTKYSKGEKFLLSVGTLEPRKNLLRLIQAYRGFRTRAPNPPKLLIVGRKGWGYREIVRVVSELGLEREIIFSGYLPSEEMPLIYNACEFLIYPSLYEGFGLPPLEAMACGKAVISSGSSSLPEVVGEAGILVDPCSVKEMEEAVMRLWKDENLRKELGLKGLERAKLFSWEKMARQTLKIYEEVIQA
jgi:glycosyltransferase involved in cell wall biosynthesis